jgi:hypothetical protein
VDRKDRWLLSARSARHRLRAAGREEQAEGELAAFWEAKGWTLTEQEGRYLDEVAALVSRGAVAPSGRSMDQGPFAPIYRVTGGAAQVQGHTLRAGTLFSYDHQAGGQGLVADLPAQAGVPDIS